MKKLYALSLLLGITNIAVPMGPAQPRTKLSLRVIRSKTSEWIRYYEPSTGIFATHLIAEGYYVASQHRTRVLRDICIPSTTSLEGAFTHFNRLASKYQEQETARLAVMQTAQEKEVKKAQ